MKITLEIDLEYAKRLVMLSHRADPTGIYDQQNRESMAIQVQRAIDSLTNQSEKAQ